MNAEEKKIKQEDGPSMNTIHSTPSIASSDTTRVHEVRRYNTYNEGGLFNEGTSNIKQEEQESIVEEEDDDSDCEEIQGIDKVDVKDIPGYKVAVMHPQYPKEVFIPQLRIVDKVNGYILEELRRQEAYHVSVKINDTLVYKGVVIVVCEDEPSRYWIKTIMPYMSLTKKIGFVKVENYEDFDKRHTIVFAMVRSCSVSKVKCNRPFMFIKMVGKNCRALNTDRWELLGSRSSFKRAVHRISMDTKSVEQLRQMGCVVRMGNLIVQFSLSGLFNQPGGKTQMVFSKSDYNWGNKRILKAGWWAY